jgi:hypothetical protein
MKNLSMALMCALLLLSVVLYEGHRGHRGSGTAVNAPARQADSLWRMATGAEMPADSKIIPKIAPGNNAAKAVAFKDKSLARGSDSAPKISNS